MGKILVEAYNGLTLINTFLKRSALAKESGMGVSVLMQKAERLQNQYGDTYKLTESDVGKLNAAIERIGEKLSNVVVDYTTDREVLAGQIKALEAYIRMPYIYKERLGKTQSWFANRMKANSPAGNTSFKPEFIMEINLIVKELAGTMLAMELTLIRN